ncbi:MAG: diguanylate cyclase domain-containing protein [Asticcacaulis sp.]|uniref:diguanylate cyclase domain-containing protein n=1 Tax=Asticcacaulis sp. TaxID=1872648 RepID=UPI003F7BB886
MRHMLTVFSAPFKKEPDTVYVELVDILYTTLAPVIMVGALMLGIGALISFESKDAALGALSVLTAAATLIRAAAILLYRRARQAADFDVSAARQWERRYAVGSFIFALMVGAFNARALVIGDPHAPLLTTGLIFGYGSGIVARVSVRPAICIPSLFLAVAPTVAALSVHVNLAQGFYGKASYAVLMFMLVSFSLIGLETVRHIHKSILQSLTTKRDLMALAGQDALTGLPNRVVLRARLDEGVARAERNGDVMALLCLDLDRFKAVNDTLGHPAGDALLQAVAGRIRGLLQAGDTVARLGGDEFVVMQTGVRRRDDAEALAQRLIRALSAPYSLSGVTAEIGVSIGVALAPRHGHDMEQLIKCADEALYAAKRAGRGVVRFFADGQSEPAAPTSPVTLTGDK